MSDESARAQVYAELLAALKEVARLSETISALREAHSADEAQLQELSGEWIRANVRAGELRRKFERFDDGSSD